MVDLPVGTVRVKWKPFPEGMDVGVLRLWVMVGGKVRVYETRAASYPEAVTLAVELVAAAREALGVSDG